MARLPTPVPPPVRHVDRAELDDLDDQESLAKTVERRPARITTARFASVAPCALDVVPAAVAVAVIVPDSVAPQSARRDRSRRVDRVRDRRHHRRARGHARPSGAHAAVAVQTSRAPRAAVVVEANEEITQLPILAPGKVVESPVAEASPAPARPLRRSGFGHMGADRVASGAAARRAAPHRR